MIPVARPELPPLHDYVRLLEEVWSNRMLSNFATFAMRLEALAAEYLGVGVRAVSSGDTALLLAIAAQRVPPGSACLVPSFTLSSTVNAVIWNGLRPVFVDIDHETLTMDVKGAERAAQHARDVRLIVAIHVFGNPADTDGIARLAAGLNARVVYDAAHAYGSRRDGAPVGVFGDAEAFSLSGTKLVTSAEGGLVASRHSEVLERVTLLRGYGFHGDYHARLVGLNGKLSELHAALGVLTLPRIETALAARERHLERYRARLSCVPGLSFQRIRPTDRSTYKDFAVLFPNAETRARVERRLGERKVQTKRYFLPCHRMEAFRSFRDDDLPVTDATYERVLCLPLFESLRSEQVDMICDVIVEAMS